MKNPLYIIVVILLIAWMAGLVIFDAGSIIHVLLVLAFIAIFLSVFNAKKAI